MSESDTNVNIFNRIKIIISDGSPLVRFGFRKLIEKEQDMEVIAETGDWEETVNLTRMLMPDILITNPEIRELASPDAVNNLLDECPSVKLIFFSYENYPSNIDVSNTGARGYFSRSVPLDLIIHYIRRISAGETAYPSTIFRQYLGDSMDTRGLIKTRTEEISPREKSIIKYIAMGMSNKEIAQRLDMTVPAIKSNLATIFVKLGASSRTEAVFFSIKMGIINFDDLEI